MLNNIIGQTRNYTYLADHISYTIAFERSYKDRWMDGWMVRRTDGRWMDGDG